MNFNLGAIASPTEISGAINYLLANFNPGIATDPVTGQVTGPTGNILGYLYKYIAIKYADSADGAVNFSNTPTNRLYFGVRNTDSSTESTNPADYVWTKVSGGFGTTKSLWYAVTGGRQIQFGVSVLAFDVGYVQDIGVSIDLDVITSSLTSDSFGTTFAPSTYQVPYTNAPVFTGIICRLYGTNAYGSVDFVASQTDSDGAFVNNTWRIGNSSTTGYTDIVKTNITIADPTDGGSYAVWPIPTAMAANNATMAVPVRYKDNAGTIRQAAISTMQFVFTYGGNNSTICYALYNGNPTVTGSSVTKSGTSVPATTDFSPTSATAFTYAVQNPGPSQAMFQSDGIYDPVANTTNWNTPYLSNLRVGQLSAISADLGTINAGTINSITLNSSSINGGTIKIGSGHTPSSNAFEITSAGVLWADNLFSGVGYFANNYYTSNNPLVAYSYGNIEGFIGGISAAGSGGANAHGVRGANYKASTTTSGLVGAANGYDFYADGAGTNYGPFTGTHDSLVPIGNTFIVGDIVVDQQIIERNGVSSTIALVANSTTANQSGVIGVVCAEPSPLADQRPSAFIDGISEVDGKTVTTMKASYYTSCGIYNFMPLNAVGEGQINVCGMGGDIQTGDLISASSVIGKGMKQSDDLVHQYTVAKARESVTFASPTEVKMIACIYMCG